MSIDSSSSRDHILAQAETLKLTGRHEEAILLLEHLLSKHPDDVMILEELADNELSLENYDRASTAAERALTLDPKSAAAHYVLGFVASHQESWTDSVHALKKANQLSPNNPEILRCLGWALFHHGDTVVGTVTLERSLNLDADNPLALCDLGVVYLTDHQTEKAKALLTRALDMDPSSERAQECFEMIASIEQASAR